MAAAFLAPLGGTDPGEHSAENCRRLSHSSPVLLYVNVLIALWMEDKPSMIQQWHRNLRISSLNQCDMHEHAAKILEPREIAFDLIPLERSDLLMWHVISVHRNGDASYASELLQHALNVTRQNDQIGDAPRNAMLGQMYSLSGDLTASGKHWNEAVANDPRNLNYRYEYTRTLLLLKDYESALRQAILGQALEPQSDRFELLAKRIETEANRQQARGPFNYRLSC